MVADMFGPLLGNAAENQFECSDGSVLKTTEVRLFGYDGSSFNANVLTTLFFLQRTGRKCRRERMDGQRASSRDVEPMWQWQCACQRKKEGGRRQPRTGFNLCGVAN